MKTFNIGEVVKGIKAGYFVILAERTVAGEHGYQVKPYNIETESAGRGEFFLNTEFLLPADALRA